MHKVTTEPKLRELAKKFLLQFKEMHPTSWETILNDTYQPQVWQIMQQYNCDEFQAAVALYNKSKSTQEKKCFLATAEIMKTQTDPV